MYKTTLEQWYLLDAVVNEGSFALAAEKNNRSQSSLSYQLSLLQQRLGLTLLQQEWPPRCPECRGTSVAGTGASAAGGIRRA